MTAVGSTAGNPGLARGGQSVGCGLGGSSPPSALAVGDAVVRSRGAGHNEPLTAGHPLPTVRREPIRSRPVAAAAASQRRSSRTCGSGRARARPDRAPAGCAVGGLRCSPLLPRTGSATCGCSAASPVARRDPAPTSTGLSTCLRTPGCSRSSGSRRSSRCSCVLPSSRAGRRRQAQDPRRHRQGPCRAVSRSDPSSTPCMVDPSGSAKPSRTPPANCWTANPARVSPSGRSRAPGRRRSRRRAPPEEAQESRASPDARGRSAAVPVRAPGRVPGRAGSRQHVAVCSSARPFVGRPRRSKRRIAGVPSRLRWGELPCRIQVVCHWPVAILCTAASMLSSAASTGSM